MCPQYHEGSIEGNVFSLKKYAGKPADTARSERKGWRVRKHKHSPFSGMGGQVLGLFLIDNKGDVQFQKEVLIV